MKRFIRYLYEYEQGRRLRNVGFVKVEQGDAECVLHIHGKGLHLKGDRKLSIFLFYEDSGDCVGIWQGDVDNVNPAINYQLYFTREDTGVPENFARIAGVILESDSGNKYAALWEDSPVNVNRMRRWNPPMERPPMEEPQMEQPRMEEPQTEEPRLEEPQMQQPRMEEPQMEEPQTEQPRLEEPQMEQPQMEAEAEEEIEVQPVRFRCTKIQRNELAQLPKCEWRLSNNSFLLHGYYSYHHLMFLDDGEQLRLGVPGIYHVQEAKAARAFGFPDFVRVEDVQPDLSEEERNDEEQFGYWCRCVRRGARA